MHQMTSWPDAAGFFDALNKNCRYAVLRNHEDFFSSLSTPDHADIDIICDNGRTVSRITGASKRKKDLINPWNLSVSIAGTAVDLDVYSARSRYYDPKWAARMLEDRVYDKRGFYRLSDSDYYYSLIYHAAVQKPLFSRDYINRLSAMSGIEKTEDQLRNELADYMETHGYACTFPYPPIRYNREKNINSFILHPELSVLIIVGERTVERKIRSLVSSTTTKRKERS